MDVAKLKVAELKRELKARGLSTAGNKQELVDRLQASMETTGDGSLVMDDEGNAGSLGGEEEDDDDDDDEDLSDPSMNSANVSINTSKLSDSLLNTPIGSQPESLNSDGSLKRPGSKDDIKIPCKKIVLNRNTLPAVEKENMQDKEAKDDTESLTGDQQKTVKLSKIELSASERLQLRFKKFGQPDSLHDAPESNKMEMRMKPKTPITMGSSFDVLKKRAERFGSSVSGVMEQAEMEERKKKRQERFGVSDPISASSKTLVTSNIKIGPSDATTDGTSTVTEAKETPAISKRVPITAPNNSDTTSSAGTINDKKKMRAERFKIK